jgi:hypothetical protein
MQESAERVGFGHFLHFLHFLHRGPQIGKPTRRQA